MTTGRQAAAAALITSLAAVIALHLLRLDVDPASHRLSEYASGTHGWLMAVAFFAAGGALLLLAVVAWRHEPSIAVLLAVGGTGLVLSGIFPVSAPDAERWHAVASTVGTVSVTAAAVWRALGSMHGRRPGDLADRILAICAVTLLVASPVLHDTAWSGLGQRLLWLVLLAWSLREAATPSESLREHPARYRRLLGG